MQCLRVFSERLMSSQHWSRFMQLGTSKAVCLPFVRAHLATGKWCIQSVATYTRSMSARWQSCSYPVSPL